MPAPALIAAKSLWKNRKVLVAGLGGFSLLCLSIFAAIAGPSLTPPPSQSNACPTSTYALDSADISASQEQVIQTIIGVGKALGIPQEGWIVALATGLQESSLTDLTYGDRDSLGVFQQRPSAGWGTPTQILNVAYAAEAFFGGQPEGGTNNSGLLEVPNWESLPVTVAAQDVQHSAFPDAYAKWVPEATAMATKYASSPAIPLPLPPKTSLNGVSTTGSTLATLTAANSGSTSGCLLSATDTSSIVAIAESQIGVLGHGDFCNPYGPCEEWCALFVSWVWQHAGIPVPQIAFTGDLYDWSAQHGGGVLPPSATPAPGDAVFYGTGPQNTSTSLHVGIVVDVTPNGQIATVEGDTGPPNNDPVALVGPYSPSNPPLPIYGYGVP